VPVCKSIRELIHRATNARISLPIQAFHNERKPPEEMKGFRKECRIVGRKILARGLRVNKSKVQNRP